MEKVAVVKCDSYDSKKVKKALVDSLRLIGFKFKKNQKILIKPNILGPFSPEEAVTTHPKIIEELCKILKKYNSIIYIGDSSCLDTDESFKKSGIKKIAEKYGKLINFDEEETYSIESSLKIKKINLPKIILKFDLIINMPKLKTHALTNLTGAVKNLYGLIGGKRKTFYHKLFSNPKEFSELLLDIYNGVKPQLNIMDGIIGIEGFGPGPAGEKIKSNLILASKNAIALDIVSSEIIGFKAKEIPTNKIAIEKNIFNDKISIVGNAKNIKINFKKPFVQIYQPLVSLLLNMIPSGKVTFYNDRCIKCRRCEKNCPNKAIELSPYPICIHKKCIKCFCCTEICPKKSVYFRENLIYIYVRKVYGSLKKVMEK